ncbi:DUF4149 domain-containing protein [Oscillatoria amoena NRMC-F 0135]|nr:DUF4149 domain-containing protein [Oscillatoria laete-virens]MDL5051081.1 DUF4149 domain-containing protein [Oscillatoria amoena NRMC-F 0135]MDL5054528.1 DUF4149 domain-containing protein [Oscillatoria laete-virens NRMC-F 0139]
MKTIFHLMAALAAGGSIFMSFIVAPVAFSRFPKELAGDITGSLFPAYFTMQIVCGVILLLILCAGRIPSNQWKKFALVLALTLVLCAGINLGVVTPQAREYRKDENRREEFRAAHRTSMILNLVAVLTAVGTVIVSPKLFVPVPGDGRKQGDEQSAS